MIHVSFSSYFHRLFTINNKHRWDYWFARFFFIHVPEQEFKNNFTLHYHYIFFLIIVKAPIIYRWQCEMGSSEQHMVVLV